MLLHPCCYLIGAPFLLAFLLSNSIAIILTSIFAFSLMRALGAANANPLLCDLLPPNTRATAIGMMNMTNCFAGGAGILIAG